MSTAEVDDLEALFDQVSAESAAKVEAAPAAPAPVADVAAPAGEPEPMFQRVGQLTRTLHDALRELGYDRNLESAMQKLPDARDRLGYIATLTGQAADRVLGAVEKAQAAQGEMEAQATALSARWEAMFAGKLTVDEFKALACETRGMLAALPAKAGETRAQLHEIMMAQDFHDLTGQVINRVVTMAQSLEQGLLKLLIEARPAVAAEGEAEWLGGPAMNVAGRSDVVANQAQVDDLLESLGF